MGPAIIETTRLYLRTWEHSDADSMVDLFSHPEVNRFINDGKPISRDEALAFVVRSERLQRERGWCRWAIEPKSSPGELAGFCGIGCTFAPVPELGWTLRRERWGAGIATEAALGALAYAFEVVGFAEMVSAIDPSNERSKAVAVRIGMRPEGRIGLRDSLVRYRIANPVVGLPCDPRFRCDCEGEEPGSSLRADGFALGDR